MKKIVAKGEFDKYEKINMIKPPIELQTQLLKKRQRILISFA